MDNIVAYGKSVKCYDRQTSACSYELEIQNSLHEVCTVLYAGDDTA